MASSWGNVDTDIYVDEADLPDLPECKVAATADPAGLIRFDVTEDYADSLLEQVGSTLDNHDGDGLVDIRFIMDQAAYASFTNGQRQLLEADGIACKQILPEHDQPDISVTVLVNESQMQTSLQRNQRALMMGSRQQLYGQEFGVSENGARLLVTQLAAALAGEDDPLEVAGATVGDRDAE